MVTKGDLTGEKTSFSRAAKQQGVPALERENDKTYTVGLDKKYVFPVRPKVKVSATFNFDGPFNTKHNKLLELESVRVNNVAVL